MKFLLITIFTTIVLLPGTSSAQILFSEVAWMGTDAGGANDEWIELYNFSNSPTDVTGWTITLNDAPFITLAGIVSPHGVVVLERTDDDVVPGVAFQIYTGALANTGAKLQLKDATGLLSDEAIGGTDWVNIGGSNVAGNPKMTPQRTRTGSWVTGTPTPGAENVQSGESIPEGTISTNDDSDTEITVTTKTKSSGGSSSKKAAIVEKIPNELSISISAPKTVYVNQTVDLEVVAKGVGSTILSSLKYTWNFGDTYTDNGRKLTHTFKYPGEYIVVVGAEFAKQSAIARHEITVLPASFELSFNVNGNLEINNKAKHEVDLGGFTLRGTKTFVFPKFTIVKADGVITIGQERIGKGSPTVTLEDTEQTIVATFSSNTPTQTVKKPILQKILEKESLLDQSSIVPIRDLPLKMPIAETSTAHEGEIFHIGSKEQDSPKDEQGMFGRFFSRIVSFFK